METLNFSRNRVNFQIDNWSYLIGKIYPGCLGVKIDRFIITELLGSGSYGSVYKATESSCDSCDRKVALKVVDMKRIASKYSDQFRRAKLMRLIYTYYQLMKQCKSANVLKCYYTFLSGDYKIFVLEYCSGGSLHDIIVRRQSLPESYAVRIIMQVLFGLAELHQNCIIHRDLKPENIMLHNGLYKIVDFGFSRKVTEQYYIGHFTIVGSHSTMAPEVYKRGKYGVKADVWSIGIIFYVMICANVTYKNRYLQAKQYAYLGQFNIRTANNYLGSPAALSFLKQVLNRDQNARLSWKYMLEHPLFNTAPKHSLSYSRIFDYSAKIEKMRDEQAIKIIIYDYYYEEYLNKIEYSVFKNKAKYSRRNYYCEIVSPRSSKYIGQDSTKKKSIYSFRMALDEATLHKINDREEYFKYCMFREMMYHNLNCLKAKWILTDIITMIETSPQLVDLYKLYSLELMYLILHRAFTNVNEARSLLYMQTNNLMYVYSKEITYLYDVISLKHRYYGQKLNEKENYVKNKIKYKWNWVFKKEESGIKDMMLGRGVEGEKGYMSYTKADQIEFTFRNYLQRMAPSIDESRVRNAFMAYACINKVTTKEFQESTWEDIVNRIMQKYDM